MGILTEDQKKQLDQIVSTYDITLEELTTAEYDNNIYGVEEHLAVGGWTWDEEEEYVLQVKKVIECIEQDGIGEILDLTDEQWEDEDFQAQLEKEAISYLKGEG